MRGAEFLVRTAVKAGIKVCFANAGTTEVPIVLALGQEPGIRPILGLFEGVCTGAADGYGRMLDTPAMTLLHLGPGFANGIANLHNARRAKTPLLNLIGEHATWHRAADPPLAMDIETLASTVSGWQRTNKSAAELSRDLADAVAASRYGQVSSLIIPNDHQWAECSTNEISAPYFSFAPLDFASIESAARMMRTHQKTALIMGGRALRKRGLEAAARIKTLMGCDLLANNVPAYIERGAGLPSVIRIPYFPEVATDLLSKYELVVMAGTKEPVALFGYAGGSSQLLTEEQEKVHLAGDTQDAVGALEYLADTLSAPSNSKIPGHILAKPYRPPIPEGELTAEKACIVLAALQPEGAIIIDEGITSSYAYYSISSGLPPYSFVAIAGGSIGYGMPCATGAAIACPDRPVINIEADGSAMYTLQALWTQARESLNVTTLLCSNRSYNILKLELARAGTSSPGTKVLSLIDLDQPVIDWVSLARGMGVSAVSVNTAEGLSHELGKALAEPGPHLIEMALVASVRQPNSAATA
jgi:acetolactate synthase-1/2/3 large subunit